MKVPEAERFSQETEKELRHAWELGRLFTVLSAEEFMTLLKELREDPHLNLSNIHKTEK